MSLEDQSGEQPASLVAIEIAQFRNERACPNILRSMARIAMSMVRCCAEIDKGLKKNGHRISLDLVATIDLIIDRLSDAQPLIGIDVNDIPIPSLFIACALGFLQRADGYWILDTPFRLNADFVAEALGLLKLLEDHAARSSTDFVAPLLTSLELEDLQRRLVARQRNIEAEIADLRRLACGRD